MHHDDEHVPLCSEQLSATRTRCTSPATATRNRDDATAPRFFHLPANRAAHGAMTNLHVMVKLQSAHCCETCLEQQERGLICFELLTQSRHQNLLTVCGQTLETCRNQRQGRHGQVRFRIRSPPSRCRFRKLVNSLRRLTQVHVSDVEPSFAKNTERVPEVVSASEPISCTPRAKRTRTSYCENQRLTHAVTNGKDAKAEHRSTRNCGRTCLGLE